MQSLSCNNTGVVKRVRRKTHAISVQHSGRCRPGHVLDDGDAHNKVRRIQGFDVADVLGGVVDVEVRPNEVIKATRYGEESWRPNEGFQVLGVPS